MYYEGYYHLFFQHNPKGSSWGDMSWGHVVSKGTHNRLLQSSLFSMGLSCRSCVLASPSCGTVSGSALRQEWSVYRFGYHSRRRYPGHHVHVRQSLRSAAVHRTPSQCLRSHAGQLDQTVLQSSHKRCKKAHSSSVKFNCGFFLISPQLEGL
jgi:hypothetical protein